MAIKLGQFQTGESRADIATPRGPRVSPDLSEANAIRAFGAALGDVGRAVVSVGRGQEREAAAIAKTERSREIRTAKARADSANTEAKRRLAIEMGSFLPANVGNDTALASEAWSKRSSEITTEVAGEFELQEGNLDTDYYNAGLTTTLDGYNSSLVDSLINGELAKVNEILDTQEQFDIDYVTRQAASEDILDIHAGLVNEFVDKMQVDAENELNQAVFVGEGNTVEDRANAYSEKLGIAILNERILQDPTGARDALDALKPVLTPDTIKTLETDITKQEKLRADQAKAERDATAQTFANEIERQGLEGTVTETQLITDPRWEELTTSEKNHLTSVAKKSSPFNTSDPIALAELTTQVNTAPEELTDSDFDELHGDGISTADYNRLIGKWKTKINQINNNSETAQTSSIKRGYKVLSDAKTNNIYSGKEGENSVRWSRATQAFDVFIEQNENATPEEITNFVETLLKPEQKGAVDRTFDFIQRSFTGGRGGDPAVVTNKDLRTKAIETLTEDGQQLTEANIAIRARDIKDRQ